MKNLITCQKIKKNTFFKLKNILYIYRMNFADDD